MNNQFKTFLLLGSLTMFIVWIGNLLGGPQGMVIAFLLAAGMNFFSYWFSDKIVLRMYNAQPIGPNDVPELYGMIKQLTERANLPMPKICIIPDESPNAFATGRNPNNAVVAVTQGLLNSMNKNQVMGVIAHELAHIKNRDILIGSIAATMAGAIMILADMARWSMFFGGSNSDNEDNNSSMGFVGIILMSILAPLAAMLIQMALSRSREYLADSTGAQITGNPEGLASALETLGIYGKRIPMHNATPSTAHMFIVNPLSGGSFVNLFSTHPPLEERIRILRNQPSGSQSRPANLSSMSMEDNARSMWDSLR